MAPPVTGDSRALLAALAAAAVLRLWSLGTDGLSVDEGVAWYFAARPIEAIPHAMAAAGEVHPPGYFVLLHLWMALGQSEGWLRLLSAVPGILAVPLTWWLAREVGEERPVLAALLVATSAFHAHYSREARMYPLLGLCILVALACFARHARSGGRSWLLGYAAACCAGLYVHYFAFFAPLLAGILAASRRCLAGWLAGTALAVAGFAPWLPRVLAQSGAQDFGIRGAPGWDALPKLLGRMQFGDLLDTTASVYLVLAAIPAALVVLALRRGAWTPVAWLALPILLAWGVSQFTSMRVFEFKYFFWCVPFLALAEARALARSPAAAGALMAANVAVWAILVFHPASSNQAWREVARAIRTEAPAGALILVHPNMMSAPLLYYGVPFERLRPVDVMPPEEMARLALSREVVWLVTTPHHPLVGRLGLEPFLDDVLAGRPRSVQEHPRRLPSSVVRVIRYGGEGSGGTKDSNPLEDR